MSVLDLQQLLSTLLARLGNAIDARSDLRADREAAFREFFGTREADDAARGRFLEWYLFERRSPAVGDAPAFVMISESAARTLPVEARDLLDELAASRFSIFAFRPGSGESAVFDLLSSAAFEIDESQSEGLRMEAGSDGLIVGRLYPTGRLTYVLGPYGFVVTGEVAAALRRDLAHTAGRNGRLSQREMEWLLFGGPVESPVANARVAAAGATPGQLGPVSAGEGEDIPLERLEAEVESWLRHASVDGLGLDEVRERLERAESLSAGVAPILDEVAFESEVDLDAGRRLLPAYYRALAKAGRQPLHNQRRPEHPRDELRSKSAEPCPCGSGMRYEACCLPKDALARFEAGRAKGDRVDDLVKNLAAAMGVEVDDDAEDLGMPPDAIPPALGPLVEEYLWETDKLGQPRTEDAKRTLVDFALSVDQGPGAPGEVSAVLPAHIERFLSYDVYRKAEAPTTGDLRRHTMAIREFADWLRDEQGADWTEARTLLAAADSGESDRIAAANALLQRSGIEKGNRAFCIVSLRSDGAQFDVTADVVGDTPARGHFRLAAPLGSHLKAGDCLLFEVDAAAGADASLSAQLLRVFPAAAKPYLHVQK
jgi:hypothetical protein